MDRGSQRRVYLSLTIFLSSGFASVVYAQSVSDQQVYQAYDALVSRENTGLFNGPQVIDTYQDSWDDSHVYLESANYQYSTLVYNNQLYTEVPLRYDLLGDYITIRSDDHLSLFKIKVDPKKITSFSISNRNFIKLPDTGLDNIGSGFFEIAFAGKSLTLYIKHVKRIKRETIDRVLQQRFISDNHYVLRQDDTYHSIYSIKDFKEFSPDPYSEIRDFYKVNRSLYKTNLDAFMIQLVEFLDGDQNLLAN